MLPNLKLLRKKRGISQQALAEALGTTQQSINQYENHSIEPDIATLVRIADYFGVTIDFLVGHKQISDTGQSISWLMSEDEITVITKYRNLRLDQRSCVDLVIDTLYKD